MTQNYLKQLLIPLCHSFILLPVCVFFAGAADMERLLVFFVMLMGLSLFGWLMNVLLSRHVAYWLPPLILMATGMFCGLTFLPELWCNLSGFSGRDWLGVLLGVASGAVMVWTQMECYHGLQHGMPNYELGIGMMLYIFTYFVYRGDGHYTNYKGEDLFQPIYIFGVIWVILALVVMNYQHINRMSATKNHPRAPWRVLLTNVLFSLVMAAGILLLANLGFLRRSVTHIYRSLLRLIFPQVPLEIPEEEELGIDWRPDEPEPDEPGMKLELLIPPWLQIVLIVIMAVIALVLVVLVLKAVMNMGKTIKKRPRRSREVVYVEEVEKLLDWKDVKKQMVEKHRQRKIPAFDEMADGRDRIRWVYARLRDELRRKKRYNSTLTPNEQAEHQFPDQEQAYRLTELYNEARYSDHDISEKTALEGKEIWDELQKKMTEKP